LYHEKTSIAARGKWRGILSALGVPENMLVNKHGPCPLCGGTDRFRWDNKDRNGTYICSNCGAGDGMALALGWTGRTFAEVAAEIDRLLGNVKEDPLARPLLDEDQRRAMLRKVWAETAQAAKGDLVDLYLAARKIDQPTYPASIRFGSALADGDGGVKPALVAVVSDASGKPASLHRTFLRRDGSAKADMPSPRKMMPGELPDGACVRLSDYTGGCMGIAEGLETALSASRLFDVPVWSAINANLLEKWTPPDGCDEVAIFGDNDANFTGHAAAYRLAKKLAMTGKKVTVHFPQTVGHDWNDVLVTGARI
jgi:putative DNA primase/helicase